MTFVRAPFGDLATAAASSDRMPSGARVVGAASLRSSAFSCCHWQREPHRRKALLLSLHLRSRRPLSRQACSRGQRRIRCRGSASSSRAQRAPRRRSLRSTTRRRPTTSSFRPTRRSLRTTRSWPTSRTRSSRRRRTARGLRPSVTVGVRSGKRRRLSGRRRAVSSTTGSTSSTASRWRCLDGGSSGSLAAPA